jgi:drug/metabolite transporter (DMT)-like permease
VTGLPFDTWVLLALVGGVAQTTRNALAQSVARQISPALNSWSRFTFCLPYAGLAVGVATLRGGWPDLSWPFLTFCLATALTQLLGNVALVTAFRSGGFGESIVFHKLEVVLTAVAGALFFREAPGSLGALGIGLCATGVVAINLAGSSSNAQAPRLITALQRAVRFEPAARWALVCAVLLVMAGFSLKFANEALRANNPEASFLIGAVHTLFHTTWMEVLMLSGWIAWREPRSFRAVAHHWRRLALIGSAGFTASLCWFWAFSIAVVAYVKAVGQIEALLAVLLGMRVLGERSLIRQAPGIALTLLGIVLVLVD